jgi:type IV pilus assembly protein PilB
MQEYFSNKTIEKLKYDLVREKLLSFEDLTRAEELSAQKNLHLGQTLISEEFISEEFLLKFLEDNLHIPSLNLEDYSLDKQCLEFISEEDARKYKIIPLFRIEDVLTIAMADPLDLFVLNNLVKSINCRIEPVICSERLIMESIDKFYSGKTTSEISEKDFNIDWKTELNSGIINEFQAEKIINAIIFQAVAEDVYEIAIENTFEGKIVKFKKGNQYEETGVIPILLTPLFNSKLKFMAGLDAFAVDIPQLGKFNISVFKENIACIAATFPTTDGERINIKLYRPPKNIHDLSLSEDDRQILQESLKKAGIVLICGANLSGKSYAAYSILNSLDKTQKNIMTLESIAKYNLEGVHQCELKEKAGFSFEKAVKLIDFQSPDIVYTEEVFAEDDINYLTLLAKSGKTIITEILAEDREAAAKKLKKKSYEEFSQNVNCLIFVENKDRIHIIKEK